MFLIQYSDAIDAGREFTLHTEIVLGGGITCGGIRFHGDYLFGLDMSRDISTVQIFRINSGGMDRLGIRNMPECVPGKPYGIIVQSDGSTFRCTIDRHDGLEPWPSFEMYYESEGDGGASLAWEGIKAPEWRLEIQPEGGFECVTGGYTNPVMEGIADPDILYKDGTYYLYGTCGARGLKTGYEVFTSTDLVNWRSGGIALDKAWGFEANYWAPDVLEHSGKYYMLLSVMEHLGCAVADSPLGPFVPEETFLFHKTIDGHYFVDDDGRIYIYYASWRPGRKYAVYGMEMEADCVTPKLDTERMILRAELPWECNMDAIAEAPYIQKHNGLYYMTYSASHTASAGYCVGVAIAQQPLGPYEKCPESPILKGNAYVYGPGHHFFTTSPDGKQLVIAYHRHGSLKSMDPRNTCVDRARFVPVAGRPDRIEVWGPTNTPQPGLRQNAEGQRV